MSTILDGRHDCFLWVDLRRSASLDQFADIGEAMPARKLEGAADLPEAISLQCPLFVCFDYDRPDKRGLFALQETKRRHAHLPVLMLTEHHSEELAVWALRNRVWDYLVKPLAPRELQHSLRVLVRLCSEWRLAPRRHNFHAQEAVPLAQRLDGAEAMRRQKTRLALAYIEAHYAEPIALQTLAAICRMSPSGFSHAFKEEFGAPYSDYLLRYRLARARERLAGTMAPVKEIALSVGFNDPSYFGRAFRERYGLSPGGCRAGSGPRK